MVIVWIDADSCPVRVREVILKGALKGRYRSLFVANREIPIKKSENTQMITCSTDDQSADNYIVDHCQTGNLVITRDIPLAARLVEAGVNVVNDRGTEYTKENVGERLSIRDFMEEARMNNLVHEKHSSFSARDLHAFAACFDRLIQKLGKA